MPTTSDAETAKDSPVATIPMRALHQVPDHLGRFGAFGGRFVPETLMHAILTLHEKVRSDDITQRRTLVLDGRPDTSGLASDQGGDTSDARDPGDGPGWTPERPDAVHLGTPKRNPIIARSVGEPL